MILGLIFLFGLIFGIMLMAFEDGKPFALGHKIRCKMGYHDVKEGFGSTKVNKYYCRQCKEPRKHPKLTVLK